MGIRVGLAVGTVRGALNFYVSYKRTGSLASASLAGIFGFLFGFMEGYSFGAGTLLKGAAFTLADVLIHALLLYRGNSMTGLPIDPSPVNPTPEWTNNSFLGHIDSMSLPGNATEADRTFAKESLQELWTVHSDARAMLPPEANVPGEACHFFCIAVIGKWGSTAHAVGGGNTGVGPRATARAKFFKVYKTEYERMDGMNDHGTIMIEFADGKVAHLDNGWFQHTGGFSSDVRVYGDSNFPPNYYRHQTRLFEQ